MIAPILAPWQEVPPLWIDGGDAGRDVYRLALPMMRMAERRKATRRAAAFQGASTPGIGSITCSKRGCALTPCAE